MDTPLHAAIAELQSKKFSGLPEAARLSRLFVLESRRNQAERLGRHIRIAQIVLAGVITIFLGLSFWIIPRLKPEKLLSGDAVWLWVYLLSPLAPFLAILSMKMRRMRLMMLKPDDLT
jgi:hypothetical protein